MKNPNMEFNPEGVASLNELLEARELTGQMPKIMPIGLKAKNSDDNDCDGLCDSDNCPCDDCSDCI